MRKNKKPGFLKSKGLNIVSRFFLSSFIVISFFYTAPIIINFTDKNFNKKEFTNNSKNILNNTLNKDKLIEEDSTADADERELLYDILEENNSEINLVRYIYCILSFFLADLILFQTETNKSRAPKSLLILFKYKFRILKNAIDMTRINKASLASTSQAIEDIEAHSIKLIYIHK